MILVVSVSVAKSVLEVVDNERKPSFGIRIHKKNQESNNQDVRENLGSDVIITNKMANARNRFLLGKTQSEALWSKISSVINRVPVAVDQDGDAIIRFD